MSIHKLTVSTKVVIPAKAGIRFFDMVPDFRRYEVWMPDQVRHDGKGTFINISRH